MSKEREAFTLLKLLETTDRVECLTYYETSTSKILILGTSKGDIISYEVLAKKAGGGASDEEVSYFVNKVAVVMLPSKKKAEQLHVVRELKIILALSGGEVTLHELSSLTQVPSSLVVKNATSFCINQEGLPHRLCVVTAKRKLQLFEYTGSNFTSTKELAIPDTPLYMVWYGHQICIAYRKEYNLLNVETAEVREIPVEIDAKTTPIIKLMPSEELLIAGMERLGFYFNFTGNPATKSTLTWSQSPTAIGYCNPYVITLVNKQVLEIHNYKDQSLVQTIKLPKGSALVDGNFMYENLAKSGRNMILTVTNAPYIIYTLAPCPMKKQIEDLLERKKISEAFDLLESQCSGNSDFEDRVREFNLKAGLTLLLDLQIKNSFEYFSKSNIDPREIIALFPDLKSSKWSFKQKVLSPDHLPSAAADIFSLASAILTAKKSDQYTAKEVVNMSQKAFLSLLQNKRSDFVKAEPALQQAVDTAIFKLLITLKKPDLDSFASTPNYCVVPDIEALLKKENLYHVLALLYRGRGMDKDALQIWARMGNGEYREEGYDGISETVDFLSNCDDENLVWMFSEWVLKLRPSSAINIFTGNRKKPLSHDKVLKLLQTHDDKDDSSPLTHKYLEHIIANGNSEEKYHTILALEYIETILMLDAEDKLKGTKERENEFSELSLMQTKLSDFIEISFCLNTAILLEKLSKTDLHEALIKLYSKSQQHFDALEIIIYQLKDLEEAEKYCLEHSRTSKSENDPFICLLKILFQDNDNALLYRDTGMSLLSKHASIIDSIKVLEMIPPSTSISLLSDYFSKIIPQSSHTLSEGQVIKNLSKFNNLSLNCQLMGLKSRGIKNSHNTKCSVCQKRIDADMVFAAYPNGSVVHYNCVNK